MNDKAILIDAIIGKGFSSMGYADKMVKEGLASFTGNQWNEDWEWDREKLEAMSEAELQEIYYRKDEPIKPLKHRDFNDPTLWELLEEARALPEMEVAGTVPFTDTLEGEGVEGDDILAFIDDDGVSKEVIYTEGGPFKAVVHY